MVFPGISKLIRSQWQYLTDAFSAEDHERRVQQRLNNKLAKQQHKLARRAARKNRRAQRKQRQTLLSPTVVAEPAYDDERPERINISCDGKQQEVQTVSRGGVWARTAGAATHVAIAHGVAGDCKSKPSGRQWNAPQGEASPKRVDPEAEIAEVCASSVVQGTSDASQDLLEVALDIESKLEQKQREFYDSLGGYTTVDEDDEDDDGLHELLFVNKCTSNTRLSAKPASAAKTKAAELVQIMGNDVSKLCGTLKQQEADGASASMYTAHLPPSTLTPGHDALSSLTELVERDPEDEDAGLCGSAGFDGNYAVDVKEGSHGPCIASRGLHGLCIPPAYSSLLAVDHCGCEASIAVAEHGDESSRSGVGYDAKVGRDEEVADKNLNEAKQDEKRLIGESVMLKQLQIKVLPSTRDLLDGAITEAAEPQDIHFTKSLAEPECANKLNGPKEANMEMRGAYTAVDTVDSGPQIGVSEKPLHLTHPDIIGKQAQVSDPPPHSTVQSCPVGIYSPGTIDEYASSIYKNLRDREHRYHVTEDVFAEQRSVQPQMRAVLVDWLVEVHQRFELEPQTLYLTVNYVDRYLAQVPVNIQRFQLVGVTALLIASKFEEIYPCDIDDLLYICERSYSKADLVECERDLLNAFAFNLAVPTVNSFLGYFLENCEEDELTKQLANFFAECSLLDFVFGAKFEPSLIACACLLAASCYVENQGPSLVWTYRLVELTGYTMETIIPCMEKLQSILAKPTKLTAVATKYSDNNFSEVACLPLDGLKVLLC